jgi:hypothetical protein
MHADGLGDRHARSRQNASDSLTSRAASVAKVPSACIRVHLRLNLLASLPTPRCRKASRGYRTASSHTPGPLPARRELRCHASSAGTTARQNRATTMRQMPRQTPAVSRTTSPPPARSRCHQGRRIAPHDPVRQPCGTPEPRHELTCGARGRSRPSCSLHARRHPNKYGTPARATAITTSRLYGGTTGRDPRLSDRNRLAPAGAPWTARARSRLRVQIAGAGTCPR